MHALANYAHRLGLASKNQPTRHFSALFWNNIIKTGRVNELKLSLGLYFCDGLVSGIKVGMAMAMASVGLGMVMAKRLNPLELLKPHGCKDTKGIHAMLKKAREIEDRRKGRTAA